MIQISDNGERLDIVSPMRRRTRFLLGLLALFPLLAPYELMFRVQWADYQNPAFLLAAIVSTGAIAVSGLLAFAAFAGLSSRMSLDAARSMVTYSHGAPVVPRRTQVVPLSALESVHVRRHEWSDGFPGYSLMVTLSDGTTFESASSWSREEMERKKAQIDVFLERTQRS